jgi:TolB protein
MPRLFAIVLMALIFASAAAAQRKAATLAYQLTHVDTGEPFPSPDGKQLVFESIIEGFEQIFVMNRDASGQHQITHDAWNHDNPVWSPDRRKFAFVSDQNGHEVIYIMNIDGSDLERLTPEASNSIHPMWSPDGSKIIYCSDDDLKPPAKNASEVFSIDVRTKQIVMLISGGTNTYPSWSPDGSKIVFRRMVGETNSEVFLADGDGANPRNLTNHPAFDGWPAWSPDGKQIAFASNRNSAYQIFIMNADGSEPRLLANTEGRGIEPRWSTDGRMIYFTNCRKVDWGSDCQIFAAETLQRIPSQPAPQPKPAN